MECSWFYTADNRVAITDGIHCLDESDGSRVQIWQCYPDNNNQGMSVYYRDAMSQCGKQRLMSSLEPHLDLAEVAPSPSRPSSLPWQLIRA